MAEPTLRLAEDRSRDDWQETVLACLAADRIELLVHVPDIVLAGLIARAEADAAFCVIGATREEEGVGVVAGGYLGGRRGALLLQNSGLGNALNALASLALPYQVPFLLLVSPRGELGEFNPAQVPMGRATRPVLEALGIQHFTVESRGDLEPVLRGAARLAFAQEQPVAVLLSTRLTGGKEG